MRLPAQSKEKAQRRRGQLGLVPSLFCKMWIKIPQSREKTATEKKIHVKATGTATSTYAMFVIVITISVIITGREE